MTLSDETNCMNARFFSLVTLQNKIQEPLDIVRNASPDAIAITELWGHAESNCTQQFGPG